MGARGGGPETARNGNADPLDACRFWCLLWVAFLSLQVVEDGTFPSIVVRADGPAVETVYVVD